jgi:hypothetical protein
MGCKFQKASTVKKLNVRKSLSICNKHLNSTTYRELTYGVELHFLSEQVDGTHIVIHSSLNRGGARSSLLGGGERIGASSEGEEGSGGLHGRYCW